MNMEDETHAADFATLNTATLFHQNCLILRNIQGNRRTFTTRVMLMQRQQNIYF